MDDQQRGRIRDDLKGFFQGDLLFDDLSRALYSTDASLFQVQPLGVAAPRDEEDVQALVRYAAEQKLPLIPRGAGTGVAGESLGRGLIVDLSRHFRSILDVTDDTARVQPGVTLAALNARLAPLGRRFAPDPASAQVCTLGGMLATNASGARLLRHGYTRDHVESLRVVIDSGEVVVAGAESLPLPDNLAPGHWHDIVHASALLLEENAALIQNGQPRTPFNRCPYRLDGVLTDGHIDLSRLLVGSEGTLGIFTEGVLRTIPIARGRALVLVSCASLEQALQAARKAAETGPIACELMDRRLLTLSRGVEHEKTSPLVSSAAEAVLLVEYETESPESARSIARDLAELITAERLALQVVLGVELEQLERLWQLREAALPNLYSLKGGPQPLPFIEDIGVPVEQLPDFLRRVQEILKQHETTASFLVHAATGQVHTRPLLDLRNPEHVARLHELAEQVHSLALDLQGTISTQHGVGLARTPWVARQYGPLYPVFRQLKAIFDPRGIFNPGKIVDPDPGQPAWPLRRPAAIKMELPMRLAWQAGEVPVEANHCNGCGQCRTEATGQRMCPVFRVSHAEAASPRAKANLLRRLLEEGADGRALGSEEVRDVADLCINCKMCGHECPSRVNIPKLMLEAKAANVAQHGLDRHTAFIAHLESHLRWGGSWSILANFMLNNRLFRWLFGKLYGLAPRRRLPRFARRPFLRRAERHGWTEKPKSGPWVVYFPDLYCNHFDPLIGEAAVRVLQHHGFGVWTPPLAGSSGMEALAVGDVETARDMARRNLRVLADVAREGVPIVCTEPSTALMFRQDYLDLIGDLDARLVAEQAVEFTTFLGGLKRQGKLRTDFKPLDFAVGHHIPCHLKALGPAAEGPSLLALVPNLKVHAIDVGCSGMAGTFGLQAKNYDTSLEIGKPLFAELEGTRVQYGAAECSACRMQMEDGARKRTLHPAEYLALAYGLLPEVADRLKDPIRTLVSR